MSPVGLTAPSKRIHPAKREPRTVVLLVNSDATRREQVDRALRARDFDAVCFDSVEAVLPVMDGGLNSEATVMVVNDQLSDGDCVELLDHLNQRGITIPTVVTATAPSIPKSVEAIRTGAFDVLVEPFSFAELTDVLARALTQHYPGPFPSNSRWSES